MKNGRGLFLALALPAPALALALPARRAAEAMARRDRAADSLERVRAQAHRVLELRAARQRVAEQKRPEQDLIARVNATLAAAGLDPGRFGGVRPRSDAALAGLATGPLEYRRQTVQLSLGRLRMEDLGVVLLGRGKLYEAANEFEWARKLMPGHPDPRMNLALTLERAGRIDDAMTAYASALEAYPEHLPTMEALARCQLRHGREDDRTPKLIEAIALRGGTEAWRAWARGRLAHASTSGVPTAAFPASTVPTR